MLFSDVEDQPGFAFAAAKMPVVKNQGMVSGSGEGFSIRIEAHFLDPAEPVGKNDARGLIHAGSFEKPARTFQSFR